MSSMIRPRVQLLPDDEASTIVDEAFAVLETGAGVLVENQEARELLEAAGASRRGERLNLPEALIRQCLESAPGRIRVFDREGELALDLGAGAVHFDPGSAAIHILEAGGRRRRAEAADIVDLVRLVEGLPHYAAGSTAITPSDVPEEIGDRYRLYLCLKHGRKPVVTGTFRKDGFAPMRDMLVAVRGSEATLADKPLAIFDACPSPPLRWSDLTVQALIDCARASIPVQLISMPLAGATAPVTLREAVVQHCAESLSGIVLVQLARRGSPVIYGGAPAAFDMRHGTTPMGSMETMMIHLAYAQVGQWLGLPTHGYLALSDAKVPDYQAGMETAMGAVLASLAGIDLISGPGMLDYLLTQSLEKLLLDHEACGMALRLIRGIDKRPTDVVGLIGELVAGGGQMLSHRHTRKYWREELTVSSPLIDRDTYTDWEAKGALSARQRAAKEVAKRLALVEDPPLKKDVSDALDRIMDAEASRAGLNVLPAR
jgi:trimethylamine--corrinoid protein Co-methyltransferase